MLDYLSSWLKSSLVTSPGKDTSRLRVDNGSTGFYEGREFRISVELTVVASTIWFRASSPVGFILKRQELECDQGGIRFRAYRAWQGTPGGTFDTPVTIWPNNGIPGTPAYAPQLSIASGGTFTPTAGQSAAETIRVMSNPGGGGPTAGSRNTVGGAAYGERGLPAGDFYVGFDRLSGVSVDGLGVFNLVYEERP